MSNIAVEAPRSELDRAYTELCVAEERFKKAAERLDKSSVPIVHSVLSGVARFRQWQLEDRRNYLEELSTLSTDWSYLNVDPG